MTSDILSALIGAAGGVIAAMIPHVIDQIRLWKARYATKWEGEELVDIRHLRILRALAGEHNGRELHVFRNNDFYRPALEHLEKIGWVESIDNKFRLTSKSLPYTRRYLKWLHSKWVRDAGSGL